MSEKITVYINPELKELIPEYIQNIYDTIRLLKQLLAEKKSEEIRREGHKLKGHGLAYGFEKISSIGFEIEKAAKSNSWELIPKLTQELENYIENIDIRYEVK
ncbi:MAG: Hpt domain-containing protein [Leptospiraceae bacterium]|nr:Hpt domain-containing protein [Leptospiraceae bacterium]